MISLAYRNCAAKTAMSADKVGNVGHDDQPSLDDLQKPIEDEVTHTSELAGVLAKEKPGERRFLECCC